MTGKIAIKNKHHSATPGKSPATSSQKLCPWRFLGSGHQGRSSTCVRYGDWTPALWCWGFGGMNHWNNWDLKYQRFQGQIVDWKYTPGKSGCVTNAGNAGHGKVWMKHDETWWNTMKLKLMCDFGRKLLWVYWMLSHLSTNPFPRHALAAGDAAWASNLSCWTSIRSDIGTCDSWCREKLKLGRATRLISPYNHYYVYIYIYYVYIYVYIYIYTYIHTYITLHYITLHYITLHYITLHYITLHYITLHYVTLRYITLHYITLRYITLHHNTLHYIHTSSLQHWPEFDLENMKIGQIGALKMPKSTL